MSVKAAAAPSTVPDEAFRSERALSEKPIDDAWFDADRCRNCDAPLTTAYCPQCGQKAARRLTLRDLGKESWDRIRFFELKSLKTLGWLVISPGTVARNYVLGRRTRYMHPLTLLIALVAALVILLAANQYFATYGSEDRDLTRMADRVLSFANWSFSLGIFAIFLGSWLTFRRRLGYNAVEHAVLAVYVQGIILAANIVNMLPTLVWSDPAFIAAHRGAAQYYMYAIKLALVAVAYWQFFMLTLRADWLRLALACLIYLSASWLLLRAYAAAIFWLVT